MKLGCAVVEDPARPGDVVPAVKERTVAGAGLRAETGVNMLIT
jgi:hypothetical protein